MIRTRLYAGMPVLILLALFSSACHNIVGQHASSNPVAGYHIVFQDDFRALDLSPDGKGKHTWYNGLWFRHILAPLSSIDTQNGFLSLHWRAGQPIAETSIATSSHDGQISKSWRYGYFEARMRWQSVRGAWPAIWLVPVQDANGKALRNGTRETGEMDIFEGQGDSPQNFYATIHHWNNGKDIENNGSQNRVKMPADFDPATWHTYGLLWKPEAITWFLDNRPIHSEPAYPIFSQQDYYLVLSEQMGADWKIGNSDGVTARDMNMDVQWVRVWQQ